MEQIEKEKRIIEEFSDLRGADLSAEDLNSISTDVLLKCDFDTKTVWPSIDKMPGSFDPEKVMEEAKNPGLGIRELHRQGIDGRGVTVAIIDQALSSRRGTFDSHVEYSNSVIDYKEVSLPDNEGISNHGPDVASFLVGRECGIAPGAKLVYRATPHTPDGVEVRDFNFNADALLNIVSLNKTLLQNDRVRIVSCSIGYMEDRPEPGLDRWIEAIKVAESEDIVVSDVGDRTCVDYMGGGAGGDKEDINNYLPPLFWQDNGNIEYTDERLRDAIAKRDAEAIILRLKEIRGDDTDDPDLREKIEKRLSEIKDGLPAVIIPCDYRTMASREGSDQYMYNGNGGMSWAVPYLSGIFALVWQVRPNLKKEQIAEIIKQTALVNNQNLKVINPKGII